MAGGFVAAVDEVVCFGVLFVVAVPVGAVVPVPVAPVLAVTPELGADALVVLLVFLLEPQPASATIAATVTIARAGVIREPRNPNIVRRILDDLYGASGPRTAPSGY